MVYISALQYCSSDINEQNFRILSCLNGFVTCRASPYVQWEDLYISGTQHNRKLKFSMQTYLTHNIAML